MDTPTAYRRQFDLRRIPFLAILTYCIALLAWLAIIQRWLPMPGTVPELRMTDPGGPEAMALSNGLVGVSLYLFMWGVMMVAMMYPSTVPLFRLYYNTLDETSAAGTAGRVGTFMGTYALVWAATGVIPLGVNTVVPIAVIASEHTAVLFGGTLLILALYQRSPYKHRCLKYCRTPLGFLMEYHKPGIRGAAEMSFRFSIFCVGCCWALFAVMVVVGSMNLVWMALITVILSLERTVTWGERLARGTGIVSGIAGVAVIVIGLL